MSPGEAPTGSWPQVAGLRRARAATVPPVAEAAAEVAVDAGGGSFDAWQSLATWLREGRIERGLSVADVARTTKIQARILEEIEAGHAEELPADVFVRGFIRSYARCVGLSEAEALARYAACGRDVGPVASVTATAVAELYAPTVRKTRLSTVVPVAPGSSAAEVHAKGGHALRRAATSPGIAELRGARPAAMPASVEPSRISAQMPAVAPVWLEPEPAVTQAAEPAVAWAVEPAPVVEAPAPLVERAAEVATAQPTAAERRSSKKSRSRRRREERQGRRQRAETVRPLDELELFEDAAAPEAAAISSNEVAAIAAPEGGSERAESNAAAAPISFAAPAQEELSPAQADEPARAGSGDTWVPRMPAAPPPPRRLSTVMPALTPALIIDDADPESASRVQEVRASQRSRETRDPTKRTFLPPILLESQDRTHRQGGLTLAVIILLIAATLTLSYLMRSPGAGGGGVTGLDRAPTLVG